MTNSAQCRDALKQIACLTMALAAAVLQLPVFAEDQIHPQKGPADISLGDIAKLKLPAQYAFIKAEEAKPLLKRGGSSDEGVLGIILTDGDTSKEDISYIVCRFDDCGYVKDDDAGKLNPSELLTAYKEGTAEQNDVRKENGVPPLYVGNWSELPHYNKSKHHVVWGLEVKDSDEASARVTAINYNTRILGRKGVLSMNLVSEPQEMPKSLKQASTILASTTFVKGQAYEDHQAGDKDAGYGLAGLILGGGAMAAAAKMGVFGALGKWILAMFLVCKKFIILIVAGVAGAVAKLFGKKKESTP